MVDLTILGTASMVPTKQRNVQSFYLEFKGEGMLFDCGEGTQRQMNIAGIARTKIKKIFITHWHGDHVAGLLGLIQTIGNSGYTDTLRVYGPIETKERFDTLMSSTIFENKMNIKVEEINPKDEAVVVETDLYEVTCIPVEHGVPALAYSFHEKPRTRVDMATCKKLGLQEGPQVGKLSRGEPVEHNGKRILPKDVTYTVPGKKIVFIPDTQPCENLIKIAQSADILICESTFANEHKHKAEDFKHMTAEYAARVAADADVQRLLLTHFSQRYPSVDHLVEEARTIFPETEAAFDLQKITL
ncbi:MAG: ribonuclease Z [Candidatus Woesearchaeota archaeon]|nr:ribonuclease Z [Candidatus Woesearchaeota archaeon]